MFIFSRNLFRLVPGAHGGSWPARARELEARARLGSRRKLLELLVTAREPSRAYEPSLGSPRAAF